MTEKIYGTLVLKGSSFSFYKYAGKDVFKVKDNIITVDENDNIELNGVEIKYSEINELI